MASELIDNNEILNNLSKEERELAIKCLREYSTNGKSFTFNKLQMEDYQEVPVDIETFITNDNYLGKAWKDTNGKLKIYPFWLDQLKKLFPDNLSIAVNNFIESGARGLGKSEIAAGIIAPYLIYRVMCLKEPLNYFGLKPTEKICFAFMNITKALAEEIAVDKFQKTIQLSPWFLARGRMGQLNNAPYWTPPEPISLIIGSQSSHVIGMPIYYAFFDEVSFQRNQDIDKQKAKAIDMIDTAIGGMKTRFIKNGKNPTLLVLASSKRSDKSFMEVHMKEKLESEPDNVIIIDKPVWEVKPEGTYSKERFKVAIGNKFLESHVVREDEDLDLLVEKGYKIMDVPVTFKPQFIQEIDRALCDYAGISSSELSKYISGNALQQCIDEKLANPLPDILEIGDAREDTAQYYNFFDMSKIPPEMMSKPLCVHLDMSISGDMTGIGGTWIKGKKPTTDGNPSKDLFYQVAFSTSIKAPKGRQVSFEKNRNFIRWLRDTGFNIIEVTADTFQSYDLLQVLKAENFNTNILSVDRVDTDRICKPYQTFKSALYEDRIALYNSKRLTDEITDLERNINTGKVDHPPNGHKDACDAVCGSIFTCSKYAEKFAYDYGESLDITNEVSGDSSDTKKQITVDFEEELKKAFNKLDAHEELDKVNNDENRFKDFGMGKAQPVADVMSISDGIILF